MNAEAKYNGMEIAVVGMAGRFPEAAHLRAYWENLKTGRECISFFSEEELLEAGADAQAIRNPDYVNAQGAMAGIELFDAGFFGYSDREALVMDPQTRIFHECCWHALEDAGYDPDTFEGLIGLYAGASANLFWESLVARSGKADVLGRFRTEQLVNKDYLCTRLSYALNLKGPGVAVSTACSTSLVAIHLACQSLLNGECDMALAGGVCTVPLPDKTGYLYQEGMIHSRDGHCRPFDAEADGVVGGTGAGLVVLKRLDEALEAGDHIYALIKGSAVNNDGARKAGYTAPSVEGQAEAIRAALQLAEVEAESLELVEAHGTATALGDPVELEALKLGFASEQYSFCGLGSVKSNLGHLDVAAGVAGFIKVALGLYHGLMPPTLNFFEPNPGLKLMESPFFINSRLRAFRGLGGPPRAGVNSVGQGGTNAFVVLEQHEGRPSPTDGSAHLVLLSARTPDALKAQAAQLVTLLEAEPDTVLADLAFTLLVGRRSFEQRAFWVCSSVQELQTELKEFAEQGVEAGRAESDPLTPDWAIHCQDQDPDIRKAALESAGRSWMRGEALNWRSLHTPGSRQRISLPGYPFERQRYWIPGNPFRNDFPFPDQRVETARKSDPEEWVYMPGWRIALPESSPAPALDAGGKWLIFEGEGAFCAALGAALEEKGQVVIRVRVGREWKQEGKARFRLRPGEEDDYKQLFATLGAQNLMPARLIHGWCLEKGAAGAELSDLGFYSLFFLARALEAHSSGSQVRLTVLAAEMVQVMPGEGIEPYNSMVAGLCKVIAQEMPGIRSECLDVQEAGAKAAVLLAQVMDILCRPFQLPLRACRAGRSWEPEYRPFPLRGSVPRDGQSRFRKQGVYLITGGLGGIGLLQAEFLAKHFQARLVLTRRRPFPERDQWEAAEGSHDEETQALIDRLLEMEVQGATVLATGVDVMDKDAMQSLITQTEARWGQLNGVIHGAAAMGESMYKTISEATRADCDLQFGPKIKGIEVLDQVLGSRVLDFCMLMSSTSSVLGGLGFGAYAAANLYMDAWTARRNSGRQDQWFSVNWEGWRIPTRKLRFSFESSLEELLMQPEEGIEVFRRLVELPRHEQLVVSSASLEERLRKWVFGENKGADTGLKEGQPERERPELATAYLSPENQMEAKIEEVWRSYFGLDRIGVEDNLFDLGASSLDVIQLSIHTSQKTGKTLPIVLFFNYPTIRSLARHLSTDTTQETGPDRSKEIKKGRANLQNRRKLSQNRS